MGTDFAWGDSRCVRPSSRDRNGGREARRSRSRKAAGLQRAITPKGSGTASPGSDTSGQAPEAMVQGARSEAARRRGVKPGHPKKGRRTIWMPARAGRVREATPEPETRCFWHRTLSKLGAVGAGGNAGPHFVGGHRHFLHREPAWSGATRGDVEGRGDRQPIRAFPPRRTIADPFTRRRRGSGHAPRAD